MQGLAVIDDRLGLRSARRSVNILTVFHGWRGEMSLNCCECKLVTKDEFFCEICKRAYHKECWPKRVVEEDGKTLGCTICTKGKGKAKKRKMNDMNDATDMNTEDNLNRILRTILTENNALLKNLF